MLSEKKISCQGKTTNKTTNKQMPCTNPVRVKGYTTKRGKVVKPHKRQCPGKKPTKQQKQQMNRMRGYKSANKTALANYDAMVAQFKKKKSKKF
jgi:hypothetical protein